MEIIQAICDKLGYTMELNDMEFGSIITAVGTTATGISKLMVFVTKIPGGFTKATSAVSTFATKGVTAAKTFMSSVSAAGGGMKGLLTVISGSPAAIAVFAAAAAYGIYKLIDWASGAKAAREAQERLNETVKEWGDNVTTAFEKSEGLSKFGLTAEDFSVDKIGSDWLSQTIATWTDGKRETDEILNSTVKGFTDGTETIRTSLQSLKDSAGGTALGDLDGDLATLDAIDAEVESILKKKQNGYLSDDETARLQALMDQREAIQVKPILWAGSAITAAATGTNNYLSFPGCTLRNNAGSSWAATQYATLYLAGALIGNSFEVASDNWLTTAPASESLTYISLGYMYSTYQMYLYPEHPMYRLVNAVLTAVSQLAYEAQVAAGTAQATAEATRADFRRIVRIDDDGLHIGDNLSNGEVLIDSESVNVVLGGRKYSKFAGSYVQFGNYQLRRSSDGGLVFKLA